jgi:large subunit ribosomal protein L9
MKIILLQDIKTLGKKGEIKDVAEGYGRNFLIPKKMAQVATASAMKNIEELRAKEKEEEIATREKFRSIADKLKSQEIVLKAKEKGGKLFGSVTQKDITQALKNSGFDILEKAIIIKEAIKKTGQYEITVELSRDVETKIKLIVEGEK